MRRTGRAPGRGRTERGRFDMRRIRIGMLVAALVVLGAPPGTAHAADRFPQRIALPNGFQPEGIASTGGTDLFVGSIPTGAVWRGDARTGSGAILVPPHEGRSAIGIKVAGGLIFVAGGA